MHNLMPVLLSKSDKFEIYHNLVLKFLLKQIRIKLNYKLIINLNITSREVFEVRQGILRKGDGNGTHCSVDYRIWHGMKRNVVRGVSAASRTDGRYTLYRSLAAAAAIVLAFTAVFPQTVISACATPGESAGTDDAPPIVRQWDFSDGTQNWVYDDSWSGDSYTGETEFAWDEEKQMLKLTVDFSGNADNGYSQIGVSFPSEDGIDYSQAGGLDFDFYYDAAAYTTGDFTVKAFSDNVFRDQSVIVSQSLPEDTGDGLMMVNISLGSDAYYANREHPKKLMLQIIGNNTDYKGDIWIDNITLRAEKYERFLVESTVKAETATVITGTDAALTVNGSTIEYAGSVQLTDPAADAETIALYQYLKAVGESDAALFGHMEDTILKAGAEEYTESDTKDVTGSISSIVGLDIGGLFSGCASKYNERHSEAQPLPDTNAGNIKAAALLSNEAIAQGAVITLSSHMPNFAGAAKKDMSAALSYDRYDFSGADSYSTIGDCMNQLMPGGRYHDAFLAHLDAIADYIKQVDGPVLLRLFHENTGSWFWWGSDFCDAEAYKNVYRYSVEYLRDERKLHNVIYVYAPGSEAENADAYGERYPGDAYVDMIGFDTYDSNPVPDEEGYGFQQALRKAMKVTDDFAKAHGKLFALTETGMSFASGGGIPEAGNRRPEWYSEILDIVTDKAYDCCFVMLWSNYSRTGGYYTPFIIDKRDDGTLFGHELLDPFLTMYNNEKSIFAADQLSVMKQIKAGEIKKPEITVSEKASGYILEPAANARLVEEGDLTARMNGQAEKIEFIVRGNGKEVTVEGSQDGSRAVGHLDGENLESFGIAADASVELIVDGESQQEIPIMLNIKTRSDDPHVVDDFEVYGGLDELLKASWYTYQNDSCEANVSITDEFESTEGYALRFDYKNNRSGWAGCEIFLDSDWSDCDALQFWVMPDLNMQKTVFQINTAVGGSYEAYLQEYPDYAAADGPMIATIPFSEFTDKGGRGALKPADAKEITSLSLWVNTIPGSEALGDSLEIRGWVCYDEIRAVAAGLDAPAFEALEGDEGWLEAAKAEADEAARKEQEELEARRAAAAAKREAEAASKAAEEAAAAEADGTAENSDGSAAGADGAAEAEGAAGAGAGGENGAAGESAAADAGASRKVPAWKYALPVISGGIAILAIAAFAVLCAGRRKAEKKPKMGSETEPAQKAASEPDQKK